MNTNNLRHSVIRFDLKTKRILSTKTKLNQEFIYCCNLSEWLRYKDCTFRYEEVLFFLNIPKKSIINKNFYGVDLKKFSILLEKKIKNKENFYSVLIETEIYFNNQIADVFHQRLKLLSEWRK